MLRVREEDVQDAPAIRSVHQAAFGRAEEADLVDDLRAEGVVLLSLVAETNGRIVGHVLFSRMAIETTGGSVRAVALAPVAVEPIHQRQGIGEGLVRRGLAVLCERGEKIVIVVGHPRYYPRFGFSTEKAASLESPFSPDAFMAVELSSGALDGVSGKVTYARAFKLDEKYTSR